ncbi:hypothetical protein BH11BAC6_BH11BAC6_06870 [soil metagenome]
MKLIPITLLFMLHGGYMSQNSKVVQINIDSLLNARPVTTLTDSILITWTKGIDGGGLADGYLTQSAAAFKGDKEVHALPDDPLIPGNDKHPEILLHYKNTDDKNNQARYVTGAGEFVIDIPKEHYVQYYLALSSAEGPSQLQCELLYIDGKVMRNYLLPDYYNNVAANDTAFTYVLTDLAKWDKYNNMKEKDHHNIHLLKLNIDANSILKGIRIKKSEDGYLIFWSATGVLK